MPFSAADLATLDRAIATGELSVEFADRKVTYRSIADLKQARELVLSTLSTGTRSKQSFGTSRKGFGPWV